MVQWHPGRRLPCRDSGVRVPTDGALRVIAAFRGDRFSTKSSAPTACRTQSPGHKNASSYQTHRSASSHVRSPCHYARRSDLATSDLGATNTSDHKLRNSPLTCVGSVKIPADRCPLLQLSFPSSREDKPECNQPQIRIR